MHFSAFRKFLPLLAPLILFLAACGDDDPVAPGRPLWREILLDMSPGDSQMNAVSFSGNQGLAMGLVLDGGKAWGAANEFFRLQADGSWLPDEPGTISPDLLFWDLALDTSGKPVLAGAQKPGSPSVVLDLRGAAPATIEQGSFGMLVVEGKGSFMVAGGRSSGGGLWTSTGPGAWTFDLLPLTRTNDSGFPDVCIRGDRAVACGYDDGADTLQVILTRTAATDWEKIQPAGPFTRTYFCIALNDEGTIFVGGIDGAGGMSPRAFLSQRTADGRWAELILPDPELLHGVNDILVADDGGIYLACMGEGDETQANLLHADSGGVRREITPFPGGLLQLGQAADGDIYAVGFHRNEQDGSEKGVMLVRSN